MLVMIPHNEKSIFFAAFLPYFVSYRLGYPSLISLLFGGSKKCHGFEAF